jgi:hypothetical protein
MPGGLSLGVDAQPPASGITFVAGTAQPSSNNSNVTSSAIDTTLANFLVLSATTYASSASVSDSYSNTWTSLTQYSNSEPDYVQLFYCASAIVGTGHTFTVSGLFPAVSVAAFSGVDASPYESGTGGTGGSASAQPGSVTPSESGDLIITGINAGIATNGTITIDSGFTAFAVGNNGNAEAGGIAYLIQAVLASVNPTWSWSTARDSVSSIAVFKHA